MTLMQRRWALMAVGKKARLPAGYQEVEWIANPYTSYTTGPVIKTNCYAKLNTKIQCGMRLLRTTGDNDYPCFFGCKNPLVVISQQIGQYKIYASFGNIVDKFATANLSTTINDIEQSKNGVKINGATAISYNATSVSENQNSKICIFARDNNGTIERQCGARCSYFKIYEGDTIVFDGVPCYRKTNGIIGMYDLVSNTFFTNAGTGTFTKGADVN